MARVEASKALPLADGRIKRALGLPARTLIRVADLHLGVGDADLSTLSVTVVLTDDQLFRLLKGAAEGPTDE